MLKVIRTELEVKNFNLNYLSRLSLSTKVRDTNSQSTDVLCCGGGVNSVLETREQVDAWSWLGQKVDATYPE